MDELLVQDLDQYPVRCPDTAATDMQTFNSFFSRRLKPSARPITSAHDPSVIVSPADCRLTVFDTVDKAKQFWCAVTKLPTSNADVRVKGQKFSIPSLLMGNDKADDDLAAFGDSGCALAIARLAPQDYHRFHSPVEGTIVGVKDIKGQLPRLAVDGANGRGAV
jgi:phosphatidylserine decarboxylase